MTQFAVKWKDEGKVSKYLDCLLSTMTIPSNSEFIQLKSGFQYDLYNTLLASFISIANIDDRSVREAIVSSSATKLKRSGNTDIDSFRGVLDSQVQSYLEPSVESYR